MPKAKLYLWSVNIVGMGVILESIVRILAAPVDLTWLIVAACALFSGATVLRLPFVSASFSVGDAFSFCALFLYGVEAATLTVALDTLAISLRLKGSMARTVFNVAAPCLAMWCAGTAIFGLAEFPLPVHTVDFSPALFSVAASVAIVFGVGSWFIAGAVALHDGRPISHTWRKHFAQMWANPVACGYAGALMAIGIQRFGVTALIAIVPIPIILYFAFRAALGRISDHVRHLNDVSRMYQSTIEAFATAVDAKDQVTHGHIRRVQTYSIALARQLKADDEGTLKALEAAALLHDVGKIGIPEHILNKPGRLTPAEFEVMKHHVKIGSDILSTVEFPFPVVPIVKNHHESWDGGGYPAGTRGEDIPLGARILSVVDCFDALTSDRPYRAALTVEAAFDILRARRGSMYDPRIVDQFIEMQPRLPAMPDAVTPEHAAESPPCAREPANAITDDGNGVARGLVEILAAALPDHLCVAYEVDLPSASVAACATAGPGSAEAVGHRVSLGHGVSGWVAANGSQIQETDAVLDFPGAGAGSVLSTQRCSSVALPLLPPLVITVYGPAGQTDRRAQVTGQLLGLVAHLVNAAQKTSTPHH